MAKKKTTKKAPAGAKKRRAPAPPPRMSKKEREELEAQQTELEEQKRANSVRITSIVIFAVSFLLPHRSDSDIISPYSILVNTFLHFFEINFSNTIHPAFLQCFR